MAFGVVNDKDEEKSEIETISSTPTQVLELDGAEVQSIPSLCMSCEKEGLTRVMLTMIPHFRELVIMAFECPHCNERNNEVQFAGQIQPKGCKLTLQVPPGDPEVRNRQVVKSDSATVTIPELEFEIPTESQKGSLSTVEGLLRKAGDDLKLLQEERRKVNPPLAEAIDHFLTKLDSCANGDSGFSLVLDDPAGNSFIQNPHAPAPDPLLTANYYDRTGEQNSEMGFLPPPVEPQPETLTEPPAARYVPAGTGARTPHGSIGARALLENRMSIAATSGSDLESVGKYTSPEEVMVFPGHCSACAAPVEQRMFLTNIPYFKEVIVMVASCDACGYKNSELKAGGRIPEKGRRIALRVKTQRDLSRDVIKSDTASVAIPEIELELSSGTLGGRVTTVEGLLSDIQESLKRVHGFGLGDSAPDWEKSAWVNFDANLTKLLEVTAPWTLILDDALANSFIAPEGSLEDDDQLASDEYTRTFDQNEELGLNDIDTKDFDNALPEIKEESEVESKEEVKEEGGDGRELKGEEVAKGSG